MSLCTDSLFAYLFLTSTRTNESPLSVLHIDVYEKYPSLSVSYLFIFPHPYLLGCIRLSLSNSLFVRSICLCCGVNCLIYVSLSNALIVHLFILVRFVCCRYLAGPIVVSVWRAVKGICRSLLDSRV